MKNVFFLLILIFMPLFLFGQNGCIEGRVLDGGLENEGLFGATVKVLRNDTIVGGCVTDLTGEFRSNAFKDGDYTLEFTYNGYKTERFEIKIDAGMTIGLSGAVEVMPKPITRSHPLFCGHYINELVRADKTETGQTFTAENLKNYFR